MNLQERQEYVLELERRNIESKQNDLLVKSKYENQQVLLQTSITIITTQMAAATMSAFFGGFNADS